MYTLYSNNLTFNYERENIFKTMHKIHLKESKHSTHSHEDETYKTQQQTK